MAEFGGTRDPKMWLDEVANLPPGFGATTEAAPAPEQTYRYGQWQDGRVSRWVIDCPLCSRDDEGWMIRFDHQLRCMVRVSYRTKKQAEAALNDHYNGDHTVYVIHANDTEETSDGNDP